MRHVGIFLFKPRDLGLHELVEAGQLLLATSARLSYGHRRAGPSEFHPESKRTRGVRTPGLGRRLLGRVRAGLRFSSDNHHPSLAARGDKTGESTRLENRGHNSPAEFDGLAGSCGAPDGGMEVVVEGKEEGDA